MGNFNRSDEARRNRLAAMTDEGDEPARLTVNTADPYAGRRQLREACSIRLDRIIADPLQPRKEFDEDALVRLAESLRSRGQLQPCRVRWDAAADRYVIVVGERRYRAAGRAGMTELLCVVTAGNPTAADLLEDQLVENALREDLRPVEQARAFRSLLDGLGLTQQQLAARVHVSQTTISQCLSLLDLPAPVQAQVDAGMLAPSAAYMIAKVGDADAQVAMAEHVAREGLNRAETTRAVRAAKPRGRAGSKPKRVTERVIRGEDGVKITVERRKGLDDATVVAALRAALSQMEANATRAA